MIIGNGLGVGGLRLREIMRGQNSEDMKFLNSFINVKILKDDRDDYYGDVCHWKRVTFSSIDDQLLMLLKTTTII